MYTPQRLWLPTTKTQSVLVYVLNVLLLLNLTVIVVLLSDTGSSRDHQPALTANAPIHEAAADQASNDTDAPEQPAVSLVTEVLATQAPPQSGPAQATAALQTQPIVVIDFTPQQSDAGVNPSPTPAESSASPVEFFGVGLE